MMVDMFRSEECYKTACKPRNWEPMTKEEINKELRRYALSTGKNDDYFEYEGFDAFPGQNCIEFKPQVSDKESLVFSYDAIKGVYFYHMVGRERPCCLRIYTVYGVFEIVLEDLDGQA